MSTVLKIAANRRNAKRSTGPRTEAGKAISRRNALTHGMTGAKLVLIDGEDEEDFADLRKAIFARFEPQDAMEVFYAESLVATMWRLKRPGRFEALLIEHIVQRPEPAEDPAQKMINDSFAQAMRMHGQGPRSLGSAIDELLVGDQLTKIWRYEAHLIRQARQLAEELHRLISERSISVVG